MSILKIVPAIFFTLGVSIAIINVDGSGIELVYTNKYTYISVESDFVYIKLKSEGGTAKIILTDAPLSSPLDSELHNKEHSHFWFFFPTLAPMKQSSTQVFYEFSLHDFSMDNLKSQFAVNGQMKAEFETPGIFSSDFENFVEILLYWNSNYLIMSRIGDQFPLFHWKDQNNGLQRIKYIGISIEKQNKFGIPFWPWTNIKNQWMINFLSPSNTSYAFGETITKPTFEDKDVSTTELPSQEQPVVTPQNLPQFQQPENLSEFPPFKLPTLDEE